MCYHRSFIVTEDLKVLSHPTSDRHTDIRHAHAIREEGLHKTIPHCAIECHPTDDHLLKIDKWDIMVDQPTKPDWYTKKHHDLIQDTLRTEFSQRANVNARTYRTQTNAELPHLCTMIPRTVLISDGAVYLKPYFLEQVTIVCRQLVIDPERLGAIKGCKFVCEQFVNRQSPYDDHPLTRHLFMTGQLILPDRDAQWRRMMEIERRGYIDSRQLGLHPRPSQDFIDAMQYTHQQFYSTHNIQTS